MNYPACSQRVRKSYHSDFAGKDVAKSINELNTYRQIKCIRIY